MRLMATLRNTAAIAAASLTLLVSPTASAERINEQPSAGAMVADALVARPLYFVLSQAGSVIYGATLPFTLLGGNADQAAETLVVTPLQAAFLRCLGCGQVDNQVSRLSEVDGSKRIRHFLMLSGGVSTLDTVQESEQGMNFGVHVGTHFALSDASRFDVMLGVKRLADIDIEATAGNFTDNIFSYQIVNRFGLDLGGLDLMFKLGGHYWDVEREYSTGGKGSVDGFGFLYGVGADVWLTDGVRFGLDVTRYDMEKSKVNYDASLTAVDLSLSFVF